MDHHPHLSCEDTALLKGLTPQDFLSFGAGQIAYIRPLSVMSRQIYVVHAADGTPLALMESVPAALAALAQNDLEAVSLQ